ncbi:ubiquitin-associated domain-containing protein 1 [Leptopilina heterotoma]|uniref:ubiquitin-associated domain-containing protein 1 n=1 Tax=Leptopilina heterotoma TaxID=63436 RepID=UPI001CA8EC0B|nr:ubiquitin-associated domain-containing protein 1 [Leptopilina heterotoma]XP_043481063.1 ubiquitin-associated domain-containing protein 1 [Leptopilina heterotoma]
MLPWIREHIVDAWHSRKSSRAQRRSLILSSIRSGVPENRNNAMLMPSSSTLETFTIKIISLEGSVFETTVKPEFTIEKVKTTAMKHFYDQDESKTASSFRLVHANNFKVLDDDHKLTEEDCQNFDELLLSEIRPLEGKENLSKENLKGPTEDEILNATADLPIKNPSRPMPNSSCPVDFQQEIHKILITLVQASAKILMYSPDADKFYKNIRERLETRYKPPSDPKAVKYLMDMGFTENKVIKALRLRKMNTAEALEWLIEHEDDEDEEDLQLPVLDLDSIMAGPSTSDETGSSIEPNLINIVALTLESFRQYKKLEFKPSPKIVHSLQEMGFEEKKIIEALKVTGNNQSNACEWLLGERRRSLQDLDEGIKPEEPIYKAIMTNPHIQLSLTNPKFLHAYLSILETPSSTNLWINDPEVSPVLSQIFKTYHAEKHALDMGQFNS